MCAGSGDDRPQHSALISSRGDGPACGHGHVNQIPLDAEWVEGFSQVIMQVGALQESLSGQGVSPGKHFEMRALTYGDGAR